MHWVNGGVRQVVVELDAGEELDPKGPVAAVARAWGGTILAQVTVAAVLRSAWNLWHWGGGKVSSHQPVGKECGNG